MKNKFILLLGFFFIVSVSTQELDENFLNSLPDDIKEDLVQKNAEKGKNPKENYRPYLYTSKLSQAEELISSLHIVRS